MTGLGTWTEIRRMRVLVYRPAGWRMVVEGDDGGQWLNDRRQQSMIWSVAIELDNHPWLHASTAYPHQMPTYDDLVMLRDWVATEDESAYQVFPPRAEHVNIHPNALHLWIPLGHRPLPDFTRGKGSL